MISWKVAKIANKAPSKMVETTEQDLCIPWQGSVPCEALIALARWALEMVDQGKTELFPLGSEELAQFFRATVSLNCSFV